nr:hypothetical protein [Tanacetum cinerariifolium]
DHGVNSAQNPPHINECCYECGDALDGIFCQQCTFTPNEPVDSLSMRDEHLDTIPATESDEFIKSCVEKLVPNPNDPIPPSIKDDDDSEWDILFLERLLHDDPIPLPDTLDFSYEVRL